MRLTSTASVRNDLIQEIVNNLELLEQVNGARIIPYTYTNSVAPHAEVVRISYTVPADTFSRVSGIHMAVQRFSAASTNTWVRIILKSTKSGESEVKINELGCLLPNVNDIVSLSLPANFKLNPDDALKVYTKDENTGGIVVYNCNLTVQQYTG